MRRSQQIVVNHKSIFNSVANAIIVTDLDGTILEANPACEIITGYSRDEIIGETPAKLKSDRHDRLFYEELWTSLEKHGAWDGEIWDRRKNGEIYPKSLSIKTLFEDGSPLGYVGVFSDISRAKRREEALLNQIQLDPLTSIPNRSSFKEHLCKTLSIAQQQARKVAVFCIGLDGFKKINDALGQSVGDELLVKVVESLQSSLKNEDIIARIGGDEFALTYAGTEVYDVVDVISSRVFVALSEPVDVLGHSIRVRASAGISIYPDDANTADELMQNANEAMFDAKRKGTNKYLYFTRQLHNTNRQRLLIENKLMYAIENDEFDVYYQPQFNIHTNKVIGYEALIRWHVPDGGIIGPDEFIPVAEESGLIIDIGQWVFRTVCRQLREYVDSGHSPIKTAINLSAEQFSDSTLIMVIKDAMEEYRITPNLIELEITESTVMNDTESAIQTLGVLADMGFSISIDDFGTGYSSLAYLKKFPVDKLKIDRMFVSGLPHNNDDASLTEAMITLAANLGIDVVAEGVETKEQIEFLRQKNCKYAQGYYYSKPLEFNKLKEFTERH